MVWGNRDWGAKREKIGEKKWEKHPNGDKEREEEKWTKKKVGNVHREDRL